MTDKAVQVTERAANAKWGNKGTAWYKPYTKEDKGYFKILWSRRTAWSRNDLRVMIDLFGTAFIIVDDLGNEIGRVP